MPSRDAYLMVLRLLPAGFDFAPSLSVNMLLVLTMISSSLCIVFFHIIITNKSMYIKVVSLGLSFFASFENHGLTIEKGGATLQKKKRKAVPTDSLWVLLDRFKKWSSSSLTTVHTNSTSASSAHPVPVGPGSLR